MSTAVAAVAPVQIVEPSLDVGGAQQLQPGQVAGGDFGSMVVDGLQAVNQQLMASQVDMQQLAVGNVQNLHEIMMRMEESRLSFQLVMQVRGRLLDAYQDVMKMQL